MKFNLDLANVGRELKQSGYSLYPHQRIGVKWLIKSEKKYGGGILADEMGLGKTIQIISLLIAKPQPLNLIICPASLVAQWIIEINKFAPSILVHKHFNDDINLHKQNVIVVSYNKINRDNMLWQCAYSRVICDEAHYFRNPKSTTFKNLYVIKSDIRWVITGTPIQNYKKDIITLFKYIRLEGVLAELIKTHMLRRTTKSLMLEMPEISKSIKFITEHNPKLVEELLSNEYMHHLERIFRLKQACIMPNDTLKSIESKYSFNKQIGAIHITKLNSIVKDIIKGGPKKTIIFSYFRSEIRYLYKKLIKHLNVNFIDGSISTKKKEELIHSKTIDVLIIQINAGGTGLNLQHYNNVIFTGPQWNPTVEQQAVARVYRIGQLLPVSVKRYICGKIDDYSIEKKIMGIQQDKLELIKKYII